MSQKIILCGGGGHAKVVADCVVAQGDQLIGFVDNNPNARLFQVPHMGTYHSDQGRDCSFVIAIGNNELRNKISREIVHRFASVIHPTAAISPYVKYNEGCMILHRAVVQAGSVVGNHVILNTASQVDHDCTVSDYVHIGPGAILCGDVTIGQGAFIGAGAVILPGIKIGEWSTIGAGTVVTKNVSGHAVVFGNPGSLKK